MSGRKIYQQLCEAPDLSAAVAALSCAELTAVASHLGRLKQGGLAAQVWGVVREALEKEASR